MSPVASVRLCINITYAIFLLPFLLHHDTAKERRTLYFSKTRVPVSHVSAGCLSVAFLQNFRIPSGRTKCADITILSLCLIFRDSRPTESEMSQRIAVFSKNVTREVGWVAYLIRRTNTPFYFFSYILQRITKHSLFSKIMRGKWHVSRLLPFFLKVSRSCNV
jgi:hypothetical protein